MRKIEQERFSQARKYGWYYIDPAVHYNETGMCNVVKPQTDTMLKLLKLANKDVEAATLKAHLQVLEPMLKNPGLALFVQNFGVGSRFFVPWLLMGHKNHADFTLQNKLPWLNDATGIAIGKMAYGRGYDFSGKWREVDLDDPWRLWVDYFPVMMWQRQLSDFKSQSFVNKRKVCMLDESRVPENGNFDAILLNDHLRVEKQDWPIFIRHVVSSLLEPGGRFQFSVPIAHWSWTLMDQVFGFDMSGLCRVDDVQQAQRHLEQIVRNLDIKCDVQFESNADDPVGMFVTLQKLGAVAHT